MFSIILLLLNVALFLYLLVYGICFICLPFIRPAEKGDGTSERPARDTPFTDEVSILIPCHNEGPGLVSTVSSVLEQDYQGPLKIVVLIKDTTDSSFAPLQSHFNFSWKKDQTTGVIFRAENREAVIYCVGEQQKKAKLNAYLPKVKSPYLALLDADHRAKEAWISNSLRVLTEGDFCGVQSRRGPLSLQRLPQLWDSAQNHIGNELVSVALKKVVGLVFFTGTSCVFRTERLKGRTFNDCVTEDTYLSYELLRDGEKITYTEESGTNEEVSPDIHSYVARRRRWSCGHNQTIYDLGRSILRSNIGWRAKVAVLIHGLFYTVPVAVCLLLNVYALHLFVQYTPGIRLLIALITLIFSTFVTLMTFGRHRSVIREIVVLFIWIFPQLTLIFPLVLYHMEHELYFFLSLFPYMRYIIWMHLFCLLAPFVLLLMGSRRIRVLQTHQLLGMLISYPLFVFLDLWACLLGFSDFLFGRPTWAKIQRTFAEDMLQTESRGKSSMIIARWVGTGALLVFLVVSFNDLTADSNCGKADALLFEPRLFLPKSEMTWELNETRAIKDSDSVIVTFQSSFSKPLANDFDIAHKLDGKVVALTRGNGSSPLSYQFEGPLGWDSHRYEAVMHAKGFLCKRRQDFTTNVRELKGKKLYLNGEEFFVKGIIPSFSPTQEGMTPDRGLSQIKSAGANVVRYYHELRREIRDAVARASLLVVDQPDRSTWSDVNLLLAYQRTDLEERFERLVNETRNFPYLLFHTLGNELEILHPERDLPYIREMMEHVVSKKLVDFFSYSTFYVFLRLPSSIYGVNMLDSSTTYWKEGLQAILALDKPFYASEFGGFVAFLEWTPLELRMYRLEEYYQTLLAAGAFGVVIHQSHDNWSQPVVEGYNDPLSPDQPDDLRGLWDVKNQSKSILPVVERLFSDFEARSEAKVIIAKKHSAKIVLKNRRPYSLSAVRLEGKIDLGNFQPGETKDFEWPITEEQSSDLILRAEYSTHHGLPAISQIHIELPIQNDKVVVLNHDAMNKEHFQDGIRGKLYKGDEIRFLAPTQWSSVQVNGQSLKNFGEPISFPVRSALVRIDEIEVSPNGADWQKASAREVQTGPQRIRFRLPEKYPSGAQLLLAGLGATEFWLKTGSREFQKRACHFYRENLIPIDELALGEDRMITLLLPRNRTVFISKADDPRGKEVGIPFEAPKVFSPVEFEIRKGPQE